MSYTSVIYLRSRVPVFCSDHVSRYDIQNNGYLASISQSTGAPMSRPLGYFLRRAYYYNSPLKSTMNFPMVPYTRTELSPRGAYPYDPIYSQATYRPDAFTYKFESFFQPFPFGYYWNIPLKYSGQIDVALVFLTVKVEVNVTGVFYVNQFPDFTGWTYATGVITLVPGINTIVCKVPGGFVSMGKATNQMGAYWYQYPPAAVVQYEMIGIDVISYTDASKVAVLDQLYIDAYAQNPSLHELDYFHQPFPGTLPLANKQANEPAVLPSMVSDNYYAGLMTMQPPCTFECILNSSVAAAIDNNFFATIIVKLRPASFAPLDDVSYRVNGGTWKTAYEFFKSVLIDNLPTLYMFSVRATDQTPGNRIAIEITDTQNVVAVERTISDNQHGFARMFDFTSNIQLLGQNAVIVFISVPKVIPPYASSDVVTWKSTLTPETAVSPPVVMAEVRGTFTISSNSMLKGPGISLLSTVADKMSVWSLSDIPINLNAEAAYKAWIESSNWGPL